MTIRVAAAVAILVLATHIVHFARSEPVEAESTSVRVTHYTWTGSPMYSGIYPYHGAAACSWNFPLWTVLRFRDGRTVTCLDRGMLGWSGWVDIYAATPTEAWRIQQAYEYYSGYEPVEIIRWGAGP